MADADAMPRRGRLWVAFVLVLCLAAFGYAIVHISTRKPGPVAIRVAGISNAQEIFGGVQQAGDQLGSNDAPVAIQIFNDLQCSNCRQDFLGTIPGLVNDYVRQSSVKLLYRHYSVSDSQEELGFYGAEAAAAQGYGWQYTYLFFRNQDQATKFGIDQRFLDAIAGGVEGMNESQWQSYLDQNGGSGGPISRLLASYDKLGIDLGIRTRQAAIVTGPNGTRTLQDGPSLAQIEQAIRAVR